MNERILVIRFSSLGDILLTTPVIVNLRIAFPHGHIVFLTKESFRPVVELFDGVDEIATIPDHASVAALYGSLMRLDSRSYTHVVDLHGNQRSWLARKVISADQTAVYPKRRLERRRMVSRRHKQIPAHIPHTIDLYNQALVSLGVSVHARRPILSTERIARHGTGHHPRVLVAPGAAHPPKQWGLERFRDTAVEMQRRHGASIVWAVTQDIRPTWQIGDYIPTTHLVECVDCPIPDLAAELATCDLAVANDSGIAHLSSAVGTPVAALFGPTHTALGFAPRGLLDRVIDVDEWCRPCSLHGRTPCFRDEQYCFTRLSVDGVVNELTQMLEHARNLRPALFVDRDGTVIVEKEFPSDPDSVELERGAAKALRTARSLGYRIVVVSNQSGVARGYFTTETVEIVNARMRELLSAEHVDVDGVYYCPFHKDGAVREYATDADCRKPSPGMPEQAASELGIDLRRSVVVGDRESDVFLGKTIGARSFLVRTGYGREAEKRLFGALPPHSVFDDLAAVTDYLAREREP
ncbi:MAG: HAD-IIIA family hydrolase [candidate division Zixibacteria bacterium]|jgi:D,D-heptose 1,7-bisphosphate phosphatase|nr:HAD-IIIA family hydrolase [candidate division Zixibacteria bacterium]